MEQVVVTGVGIVSPLGLNAQDHFKQLLTGESAVTVITHPLYQEYTNQLQARVDGFDRKNKVTSRMQRKLLSTSSGFAVSAAGDALEMSGLEGKLDILEKCGLYVGSLSLEIDPELFIPPLRAALDKDGNFDMSLFGTRGMKIIDPLFLVKALPNAGVCGISVQHQVLGPNTNLTNGTTSGLMAVGLGVAAIQRGEADCVLAGGYDTLLGMDSFVENLIANRLSQQFDDPQHACRPFDKDRDGFVVGEGAAFVMLESATHARQRKAEILGEIISLAQTTAVSLLQEENALDGTALKEAACRALVMGNCSSDQLGVIYVDGLATRNDDVREASVVHVIDNQGSIPVTAATGAMGFTGAASGVFSLIHALMGLKQQVVPPLINCEQPDPDCPIHFIRQATPQAYDRALVWNSDRGVKNVAVLAGSFDN